MTRYIKKCPQCGHLNAENAKTCAIDGTFLGRVEAEPEEQYDAGELANMPPLEITDADRPEDQRRTQNAATGLAGATQLEQPLALYLVAREGGRRYQIHNGNTVGRAHESSEAEVQLEAEAGIERVHREHCRFDWHHGHWHVTAIDQAERRREFRNTTALGEYELGAGESRKIESGEWLRLSDVVFAIQLNPAQSLGATQNKHDPNHTINQSNR